MRVGLGANFSELIARINAWMSLMDEALHPDETSALDRRLTKLEKRVDGMDSASCN